MHPICFLCRHLIPEGPPDESTPAEGMGPVFCAAFPDGTGIPDEVLDGENGHDKPIKGDHGIRYELNLPPDPPPPVDK